MKTETYKTNHEVSDISYYKNEQGTGSEFEKPIQLGFQKKITPSH